MIKERLMLNEKDETFIPVNVEGSKLVTTSKFWDATKGTIVFALGIGIPIFWIWSSQYSFLVRLILGLILAVIYIWVIKRFIFQEPYYKSVLTRIKDYDGATSAVVWGIMYTNDQEVGSSIGYMDGFIGCFIRLERGSVVGQPPHYEELCDTIYSDFLHECNKAGYSIKICNTMELAAKDPRLTMLTDSIKEEPNKALRDLLSVNMALIRDTCEFAYYDTDTILLYTTNYLKLNTIIEDAIALSGKLLQGGYLGRKILGESDIVDLHTEINNVEFFDLLSAKNEQDEKNKGTKRKFEIFSLNFDDKGDFILDDKQKAKLGKIYDSYIHNKGQQIDIIEELLKQDTIPQTTKSKSTIKNKQPKIKKADINMIPQPVITQPINTPQPIPQQENQILNDEDDLGLDLSNLSGNNLENPTNPQNPTINNDDMFDLG